MLILLNVKCEIHTSFYTKDYFYWNILIVVKNSLFKYFWEYWQQWYWSIIIKFMWVFFFWIMELFLQFSIYLSGKIPVESDWFKIIVIGDNMRGQIFFISIVDILSWLQLCFELMLLIILDTVSCSNKLNWKENAIFSFKNVFYSYVFVLRNVCREGWAKFLKK